MADNVKVNITERNGTELEFAEEYELKAANIPYNNADSTLTATDIKQAIDTLSQLAGKRIDGGFANSVFLISECFDGGNANG